MPSIKKGILYTIALLILLVINVSIFIKYQAQFSYLSGLLILAFLCLMCFIPIYFIWMRMVYYPIKLSKFIRNHSIIDLKFQKLSILSVNPEISIDHMLFKSILCSINQREKTLFVPFDTIPIDLDHKEIEVLISDRYILGVKDV